MAHPDSRIRPLIVLALTLVALLALAACSDATGIPTTAPGATATLTREIEPSATRASSLPTRTAVGRASRTAVSGRSATPRRTVTAVADGSPTATILPRAQREALFTEVWQTVRDHYLYADFHGADWNAIRDEYRPRALNAATSTEFYSTLSEMVDRLDDEHSRYISPQEAKEEDDLQSGENSYVGVGVLSTYEEDAALIMLVFPDSPAQEGGLKRRDRVTHVDGVRFDPDNNTIRGPEGSKVTLTVESPGQGPRDVTLTRRPVRGKITAFANRLENNANIGYLVVPSLWADDMADQVEDRLEELLRGDNLEGIVMDLRSNEGGWRTVLTGILEQFTEGRVGNFFTQSRQYPLEIGEGKLLDRLRDVPLVVLVDEDTQSYAEVLAASLQAAGRAKVVGIKSAGNTETVYPYDFDDGSRLWVAQEGFKLPDGTNMEGRGVIPDVTLDVPWFDYSESEDPHILEALKILGEQ
jgi:carboxyl-terminal processing protease